jgi:hypothetical protein
MCATPRALTRLSRPRLLFLDHVQQRIRHAQVLYLAAGQATSQIESLAELWGKASTHRATADVALFDFPEAIAIRARLVHLAERDVHEVVAVDEVSVERFSVFEFNQLCGNVQVTMSELFRRLTD